MPNPHMQNRSPAGPPRGGRRDEPTLPAPEQVVYYENGRLAARLVDEDAERWAKEFKEIKSSQLRRFYEHVLSLRRRLDIESEQAEGRREESFLQLRPEFKMLRAKAAYTLGRVGNREKPSYQRLLQFFTNHTAAVKDLKDFEAFSQHFQAVMAFHKFYAPKEG